MKVEQTYAALDKADAAIEAARDYLATEPSGERAELIAGIKHELAEFAHNKTLETLLLDAVELLEADDAFRPDWVNYRQGVKDGKANAQQAKQVPMTTDDLYAAYIAAADQMLRAQDERVVFAFARAIEAHHGITPK